MTAASEDSARSLLPRGADVLTRLLDRLPDDAWSRQSPCTRWSVRDVTNHVTAEHLWAPRLLAGETIEDVADDYDGDVLGDDPARAWSAAITASLQAWEAAEDESRVIQMSFGPCSVGEYAQQMLVDLTVHAWDIAKGSGEDVDLDPASVQACLEYERPRAGDDGMPGIFRPRVSVSTDDPVEELVALLGRDPRWSR